MLKVSIVLPDQVPDIWNRVVPFLEQAVETSNGRMSAANTLDRILKSQVYLWVCYDDQSLEIAGAATTHVTPYDGGVKYLTVELLAGERFSEWRDIMQAALVKLAIAESCIGVELIGRDGWVRELRDLGWTRAFSTVQYLIGEHDHQHE